MPESTQENEGKTASWDLSNWGMEKEEFAKGKVEDHSRENPDEQREGTAVGESSEER